MFNNNYIGNISNGYDSGHLFVYPTSGNGNRYFLLTNDGNSTNLMTHGPENGYPVTVDLLTGLNIVKVEVNGNETSFAVNGGSS